jgi:hypothetical protein
MVSRRKLPSSNFHGLWSGRRKLSIFIFLETKITTASGTNSHNIHQNSRHQIIIHHVK